MFFERYNKDNPLPTAAELNAESPPTASPISSALELASPRSPPRTHGPRPALPDQPFPLEELKSRSSFPDQPASEQPLACLFYFFHSQMSHHTSTPPDPDLVRRRRQAPETPVHRLDTHLDRLQMHAGFNEHIKSFQAYPVPMDPATAALHRGKGGRSRRPGYQAFVTGSYDERQASASSSASPLSLPRPGAKSLNPNEERDTVLLMQFKSKASREHWMRSKEWREFYENVNSDDGGCRRMPHVRCARSLRGLMDVEDVLTA